MYGHDFCPQAWVLKREFAKRQIDHEWRDIANGDPAYQEELKLLARGFLSVPTVVFPDGTVMVEPGPKKVLEKLGIVDERKPGILGQLFGH